MPTQTFAGADNSVTFSYTWQKNHQRASTGVSNGVFQYVPTVSTTSYGSANADNGYVSQDNSISGSESFTYDGNQNMTYDGVNTLAYDVENRLVEAQNAAWGTSTYLYDPLGQRKQKQVTSAGYVVTTQFVLAGGQEIADYSGTGVGAAISLTVRGVGGLPVAAVTPAVDGATLSAVYYHHDVQGSTVAVTQGGESGASEAYTYSDFGAPGAGSWATYRYAGYRYDNETGLYYVNARYYNPNLGRFLQTDPIGLSGGTNLYAYVGNDPINFFDPTGLCSQSQQNAGPTALQQVGHALDQASDWASTYLAIPLAAAQLIEGADGTPQEEIAADELEAGAGAFEARVAAAEQEATTVYQKVDEAYIGMTKNIENRAADYGQDLKAIVTLPTRIEARAVEQAAILQQGLENLTNKINSIATSNPIYQGAVQYGQQILQSIGFK
jgi:RHS repeat-associated protein